MSFAKQIEAAGFLKIDNRKAKTIGSNVGKPEERIPPLLGCGKGHGERSCPYDSQLRGLRVNKLNQLSQVLKFGALFHGEFDAELRLDQAGE